MLAEPTRYAIVFYYRQVGGTTRMNNTVADPQYYYHLLRRKPTPGSVYITYFHPQGKRMLRIPSEVRVEIALQGRYLLTVLTIFTHCRASHLVAISEDGRTATVGQ